MSPSWIWSDKITNERVARVGYNHFISNEGEWNNCFSKFSNRVLPPIFVSTILQSVRKENLAHYFSYDVKLRLLAHSRSFLANQKARNAIVGAENLLKLNSTRYGVYHLLRRLNSFQDSRKKWWPVQWKSQQGDYFLSYNPVYIDIQIYYKFQWVSFAMLKWYYDQKIISFFSSDFESLFAKHPTGKFLSLCFIRKLFILSVSFGFHGPPLLTFKTDR